ncbi:MAG: hypothetical protein HWN66_20520, partial [Candidatus Helarchaeota archaeon]|nr:hypothetical protein [Candidatus Helarchaeota archaeon]
REYNRAADHQEQTDHGAVAHPWYQALIWTAASWIHLNRLETVTQASSALSREQAPVGLRRLTTFRGEYHYLNLGSPIDSGAGVA